MANKWTSAQLEAIGIRDKNLLVSAAAGSGKTSTLTERIIRRLTEDYPRADISELLVVTFTRAAAADLKRKIHAAISDKLAQNPGDKYLSEQLVKLGSAKICTIDSFLLEIVKQNFEKLGISSSVRLVDSSEIEVLKKSVMVDTIDYFYDTDPEFPFAAECIDSNRFGENVAAELTVFYTAIINHPQGIKFAGICGRSMSKQAVSDFFCGDYGKVLANGIIAELEFINGFFTYSCDVISSHENPKIHALFPAFDYICRFSNELIYIINTEGYAAARDKIQDFAPPKLASVRTDDEKIIALKDMRTKLLKSFKKFAENSFRSDPDTISKMLADSSAVFLTIERVLTEFEMRFAALKTERGICEFSDITRYALALLVDEHGNPSPFAQKYARNFSEVYIDEYQDVNRIQDLIFRSVSNENNRFMVGDVKQSIYGFRGSEPQIFTEYRNLFTSHNEKKQSATVFMSENFRCDENIIKFANAVCSFLFKLCPASINYRREDDLIFGKSLPFEHYKSPAVSLDILVFDKKETKRTKTVDEVISREEPADDTEEESTGFSKDEAEAAYIACRIEELLSHEKKADGTCVTEGDIAVLFRTTGAAEALVKEFEKRNIKFTDSSKTDFFENPDVLMMLSLLSAIDNPQRDVHLAGTLISPVFGFTLSEVLDIRRSAEKEASLYDALTSYISENTNQLAEKCRFFISTLARYRDKSHSLPVHKLIKNIYNSDIFIRLGIVSEDVGKNLIKLFDYAKKFENSSFKGLSRFLEYITKLIENKTKIEAEDEPAAAGDAVSLMTIHKSKGLEFPIVFLCGTQKQFNRTSNKKSLIWDISFGPAIHLSHTSGFARLKTPMHNAVERFILDKDTEEEMRILYVALTRARERLLVTGILDKKGADSLAVTGETLKNFYGRHTVFSCKNYLEWIYSALSQTKDISDFCKINYIEFTRDDFLCKGHHIFGITNNNAGISETSSDITPEADEKLVNYLYEKMNFNYPHSHLSRIPAKITVSKLYPGILDEGAGSLDISSSEKAKKTEIPRFFTMDAKKPKATDRGSATHVFFQFCDISRLTANGAVSEIKRLIDIKFIPPAFEDLIFKTDIERFAESELMVLLKNAKKIIREQWFNVLLPISRFSKDAEFIEKSADEMLAVQGVIDLILIDSNGNMNVFDYKTDRLKTEELENPILAEMLMNDRHALQLSYYADAAEEILGQKCHRLGVYSTHAARIFEMKRLK